MSVISWIILGLIAGFIGSKIVNKSGQGLFLDIALGIVGAIVGGVISSQLLDVASLALSTRSALSLRLSAQSSCCGPTMQLPASVPSADGIMVNFGLC